MLSFPSVRRLTKLDFRRRDTKGRFHFIGWDKYFLPSSNSNIPLVQTVFQVSSVSGRLGNFKEENISTYKHLFPVFYGSCSTLKLVNNGLSSMSTPYSRRTRREAEGAQHRKGRPCRSYLLLTRLERWLSLSLSCTLFWPMALILSTPIPSSRFIKAIYRSPYLGALLSGEEKAINSLKDDRNLAFASGWE